MNTMRTGFHALTIIGLLMITGLCASAQSSSGRPRIGVTLSGGGAKGLAHIGILQAIDSAGLKVDYITGTSMGSVVGGLYAAGYSADSIEAIAREIDWNLLFSKQPQISAIGIEEKDEYNKYALEVPYVNRRLKMGTGIIEGQELWLKLAELFHPVYNITDFSRLPIPFKCIGTDLSTGDAVVMEEGNIVTCIRASMAIPAVFTPVEYQGKTLVDGGIVNNFPVLDVKQMGADFVIGVNLNKGLDKAEDLTTSLDILLQLAFLKDAEKFEQHRAACNIYVLPDLKGYRSGSFDAADSIIGIGQSYGRLLYPRFKKLADSLNAIYPRVRFVKDRLPKMPVLAIGSYSVEGLKHTTSKSFFARLGLHGNNEFSSRKLAEAIRTAYGSRYYKKITYDFVAGESGKRDLRFNVEENALTTVKLGVNYNTATSLSAILNLTSRDLLFKESRALATGAASENPRLYLEYHKYLGKRRKFGFNTSWLKEGIDYPIYNDFDLSETMRANNSFVELRVQYSINRNSYLGVSHQFNNSRLRTIESPEVTFKTHDRYYHTYLTYVYNNVDRKYFTHNGWKIRYEGGMVYRQSMDFSTVEDGIETESDTSLFDNGDYARAFLKVDHYSSFHPRFVFSQNLTFGLLGSDRPFHTNAFQLGGVGDNYVNQVSFYGLNDAVIKTGTVASAMLGLQCRIGKSIYLTGRVNAALYDFYDQIADLELLSADNFLSGYGLSLGFDSVIGPIEVTSMYSDQDGRLRTNINLGFRFLKQ